MRGWHRRSAGRSQGPADAAARVARRLIAALRAFLKVCKLRLVGRADRGVILC